MGGLIGLVGQKTQIPFNLPKYINPSCEIPIFFPLKIALNYEET